MLHTQVGLGSTAVTAAVALRQPNFLQQTVGFTVIDKDGVWLTDSWGGGIGHKQEQCLQEKALCVGAVCRSSTMRCSPRSG